MVFDGIRKNNILFRPLNVINAMGLYTLEIFYANGYACYAFGHLDTTLVQKQIAYVITNIIMAFVFVYVNKGLMKLFR